MTSPEEVLRLLSDIESDRVERTVSTTKTDKFGQAICAFANDLPNHNRPGYLIIGVDDKTGKVDPDVRITDQLLQNLAAIKTDGNLQPQVSLTVEKVTLPDGDVAVVTVQPCPFTPVRYEGRIWIRNGPRKCIAGEADEKRLLEKRTSRMLTFDALPCLDASVDDLDTAAFRQIYLPKAFPEDVLKTDNRSVEQQLQALGYYNAKFNCPTYAGIIMFGKYPERFMPGCYVQYVRFKGLTRAGEIKSEYKFSGNLVKILSQLDTFVDASITNRRPVPVSALREEMRVDYPHWATRELLMNAICHRDYEGNGPVQFYQYDDRIEIMNPGGLYGKVTPENFPYVNDYRNGVVAEGMKVLGFVNRYSRGVQTVQDELRGNGNGEADFKLHLGTAFLVIERISSLVSQKTNQQAGQEAGQQTGQKTNQQAGQETNQEIGRKENDALLQDVDKEKNTKEWIEKVPEVREKTNQQTGKKAGQQTGQKTGQQAGQETNQQTGQKTGQQTGQHLSKETEISRQLKFICLLMKENPEITYKQLQSTVGIKKTTLTDRINLLKSEGRIIRKGGTFGGQWIVID